MAPTPNGSPSSSISHLLTSGDLFLNMPCPPPHTLGTFLLYSAITIANGSCLFTRRRLPWGEVKPDLLTRVGWTFVSLYTLWVGWQAGCWWAAVFSWGMGSSVVENWDWDLADRLAALTAWSWASHVGLLLTRVVILVTMFGFWASSIVVAVTRLCSAWLTVPWLEELGSDEGDDWDEELGVKEQLKVVEVNWDQKV